MKHDYNELLKQFPERLLVKGEIEYVQNPYSPGKPIIKIDRINKTATDTDIFEEDELWQIF